MTSSPCEKSLLDIVVNQCPGTSVRARTQLWEETLAHAAKEEKKNKGKAVTWGQIPWRRPLESGPGSIAHAIWSLLNMQMRRSFICSLLEIFTDAPKTLPCSCTLNVSF
ncbi:hypothetical protein Y1Q_0013815 [Alligator mississippiensis]|uniref:Uncharacterized protein n=1 Tax=Alligator mississippiensis TaxID=8496 RepID=A0A151NFR4_ALLMI|nr:hypothetical protein Y1Q_0013815 [Alligator mississippiensis]